MNRNHIFNKTLNQTYHEVNWKVAIHEAGRATAIHLGNKQKELPPVFFQIFITPVNGDFQTSQFLNMPTTKYIANIDGGRLIHTLPSSIEEATNGFASKQKIAYSEYREQKITELFLAAFRFVNERSNWLAITGLADYIVSEDKSVIECNEIIAVLESANPGP